MGKKKREMREKNAMHLLEINVIFKYACKNRLMLI